MQQMPGGYRTLMDIVQTLSENIVGRQLVPSRPPGRPSGTWRCLALHLGSSAVHTALSGQLRPPKSRRRGLANEAGMRGACVACISLPSSCISAAAAGTSAVHPVSCNQEEKEARIIQALQSIGGSLFAYQERSGTSKVRVAFTDICFFDTYDEETLVHMADGRTLFAAQRLSALEDVLPERSFARISRQMVANLDQARTIRPEFGSRLIVGLSDGTEVLVTRSHVAEVKERICIPQKGDRK